jgi:hypothetical protein
LIYWVSLGRETIGEGKGTDLDGEELENGSERREFLLEGHVELEL